MSNSIAKALAALCILAVILCGCQVSGAETATEPAAETLPALQPGWQETDGKTVYIHDDGTMATGWLELDGKAYYLRSDGSLATGWLSLEDGKYYTDENGAAVTGKIAIDGDVYLFDQNGRLAQGWIELYGNRCYGDENGHPCTGWLETDEGRYYLNANGTMLTGWVKLEDCTYYLKEDGRAAAGKLEIDGKTHYFASGGQEILLVNPWNMMPEDYTVDLTDIGGGHEIASHSYDSYQEMMTACRAAGHDPVVRSSYRTMADQKYLYNRRIERFEAKGYSTEKATELAGAIVAVPGTSEHQLGLALDIVDSRNRNLDESQAKTATQKWLMEHSWEYGWILRYPDGTSELTGIIYEPWHYRYVGKELAAEIHDLGVCLEEYLNTLTEE